MGNINFTKEHQEKLNSLLLEALLEGKTFKGKVNTELNVHQLLHECSLNTLTTMYGQLKKAVSDQNNLDEWSLTDYQQRKKASLEKQMETVSLLIGYTRYQEQINTSKEKLKELKKTYTELKESTKTPAEKLKELELQIEEAEKVS